MTIIDIRTARGNNGVLRPMPRDEFSPTTARTVAGRAGYQCSRPDCRRMTIGPHTDPNKSTSTGVAAHIYGASPGGPRYDPNQTQADRKSLANAIWLCSECSVLIDKDPDSYPSHVLTSWKSSHEAFVKLQGRIALYEVAHLGVSFLPLDWRGGVWPTASAASDQCRVTRQNYPSPRRGQVLLPSPTPSDRNLRSMRIVLQESGAAESWRSARRYLTRSWNSASDERRAEVGGHGREPRLALFVHLAGRERDLLAVGVGDDDGVSFLAAEESGEDPSVLEHVERGEEGRIDVAARVMNVFDEALQSAVPDAVELGSDQGSLATDLVAGRAILEKDRTAALRRRLGAIVSRSAGVDQALDFVLKRRERARELLDAAPRRPRLATRSA